ncbi:hypothetical protein AAFC00_006721 [Neodothiora populina]|uniref:Uncharacterized protein n=1 Tax=Neodothiora populina TaxID=2781224 RepID=A0ABR3PAX8_9PEZI
MPDFQLKPIPEDDIVYWWNVLEGRKLVTVKEYQFDPRVAMFTEENLPEPIQVLQKGGPAPDSEPGRLVYSKTLAELG